MVVEEARKQLPMDLTNTRSHYTQTQDSCGHHFSYVVTRLTIPSTCNGYEHIVGAQHHNGALPMTMQVVVRSMNMGPLGKVIYGSSRSFLTPSRPNIDTIYTYCCKDDVYNDVHGSYEHAHGIIMPRLLHQCKLQKHGLCSHQLC